MVFADPYGAEATGLGHQRQLGEVLEELAVADLLIVALHMHEQRKLHDAFLKPVFVRPGIGRLR
ncbi:hypothetical protein D3C85_1507810 [compost metagenome]